MNLHIKLIAATILLFFSLQSCKKDPVASTPVPGDIVPANYIRKIQTGVYITEVTYNADTSINYFTGKSTDNDDTYRTQFQYQGGKLLKVQENAGYLSYSYTGDHVTAITYSDNHDHLFQKFEYSYEGDDVARQIIYITTNGALQPVEKTTYRYAKPGNVSKSETFQYYNNAWKKMGEEVFIAYDTRNNYTRLLEGYPYLPLANYKGNNLVKKEIRDAGGNSIVTISYTYTYDSKGKPATRTQTIAAAGQQDNVTTSTFSYYF